MVPKFGGDAAGERSRDADRGGDLVGRKLHQACASERGRYRACDARRMPGRAAPSLRRGAIEASGDFGGDDEGGEHVGCGRAAGLSDRQDRWNDACH